ncbi:hypothetical protein PS2_018767 [Malus domestica]
MKEIRTKTTEEIIDLVILLACLLLNVREIEKGNGKRLSRKFDLQWKKSIVVRPHPSLKKLQEEEAAEKRVRSRLIIEDSYGVMFALYCLRYKGIEEELREASLDEETEKWRMISCGCGRFSYQIGQFCRRMRDLAWLIFQIPRGVSVLPILCVTSACSEYKGNNLLLYLILGYGLRKCWVDWFL